MIWFSKFLKCQKGITSIEYGLISAIIAVFIVSMLYNDNGLALALQAKFDLLKSTVVNALK
ncbi:Flp family type IVb pilin [Pasteurella multocida]|uniref:Flp family type IVb pilin n=1 Tax=Pasteurella multocida TaxID=747 RepID=UPI00148115AE|nr:Flp family type IVb pilin [Pasteurella multocida]HDR1102696.1 Flp family type IVb pilin [Pasteurella multocida]HDR1155257.1 Flp family type IVb pilin [Pasteurella multocida]HDR1155679.1 Flp family type IVb pilin [Pasteurella multocida]HDR1165696.1 Flp family type IVb pilin [Pasteurella multocida]HDR1506201.1 Flp family type IVb pilin [Pasteurella multocida]